MLKVLILLSILSFVSCSPSGEGVGIGLIHFENDFTTLIEFYNLPDDSSVPVFSSNLIYDSARVTIKTSLNKKDTLEFNPFYAIGGKGLLVLQVMERREDWLRVTTDGIKGVSHWFQAPDAQVERWSEFLLSLHRVRPYNFSQNPLRKSPSEKARIVDVSLSSTCFSVVDVQGDWIKVINEPLNCPDEHIMDIPFQGYLKWKEGDEILVNFGL